MLQIVLLFMMITGKNLTIVLGGKDRNKAFAFEAAGCVIYHVMALSFIYFFIVLFLGNI